MDASALEYERAKMILLPKKKKCLMIFSVQSMLKFLAQI